MKRLIALVLTGLMVLGGCCFAAEWPAGRSAAQPYSSSVEVNLSETMGHIMLFPRIKLPATRFCDVLGMYLPREDLALGEGFAHLYEKVEGEDKPVEVCTVDFSNPDNVKLRDLSEKELNDLIWGGGKCVEMHLSKSLEFGDREHSYFVLMDEGCFTAMDGKIKSIQITSDEAWIPVISGDYGVSGAYYIDGELPSEEDEAEAEAPEEEEDEDIIENIGINDVVIEPEEDEEEADEEGEKKDDAKAKATDTPEPEPTEIPVVEETEAPEDEEPAPIGPEDYVVKPDVGDRLYFDLVLGGDAKLAVLYSDNGSVQFDEFEFTESTPVEGIVVGDDVQWGVAFYDANNYIFDTVDVGR